MNIANTILENRFISESYFFNYYTAFVGIRRKTGDSVLRERHGSFMLDETVTDIILKIDVKRTIENGKAFNSTERRKFVLYRNSDVNEFAAATWKYEKWVKSQEVDTSYNVTMSREATIVIDGLYRKQYEEAWEKYKKAAMVEIVLDYCMPPELDEECLTILLPINSKQLEPDMIYTIGIFPVGKVFCDSAWPWLLLFHSESSVEKLFVPKSASLRVRQPKRSRISLDRVAHYRHYKDIYGDIHYDEICMEVEVNPMLVCFELTMSPEAYRWKYAPTFTMTFTSDNALLNQVTAKSAIQGKKMLVYAPFGENIPAPNEREAVTATLSVFDTVISLFTFSTTKNEQGKYSRREILPKKDVSSSRESE